MKIQGNEDVDFKASPFCIYQIDDTRDVIYLNGEISSEYDYTPLLMELDSKRATDTVFLKINSPGGSLDTGLQIVNAIQTCGGYVHAVVEGRAASMAAFISLAGDSLALNRYSYLMFHNYSTVCVGKGEEVHEDSTNARAVGVQIFADLCTPFLTNKESQAIIKGQDLYIRWNDPTMLARLKRHFKREAP